MRAWHTGAPVGRLYQVEYAMEAISHAGMAIGVLAANGIVLAAERKTMSHLLDPIQPSLEKIFAVNGYGRARARGGLTAPAGR